MRTNSIIVTWNQTELTMRCLDSLVAAGVAPETIWVVDNGSQPSAIPALGERFPAINLVRSERNLGFAGGCNLGAASAAQGAAAAEQLFFLNNDALVEPDTLERLLAALAADPGLAAVSPKVYYGDSDRVIHSTGMTVEVNSAALNCPCGASQSISDIEAEERTPEEAAWMAEHKPHGEFELALDSNVIGFDDDEDDDE